VSSNVRIELLLSTGDEPLTGTGRAVWFRMLPESEQFELGIAFVEMSPQNKRRLSIYLDRLSLKSDSVPAL
jgi:hypothetical protein